MRNFVLPCVSFVSAQAVSNNMEKQNECTLCKELIIVPGFVTQGEFLISYIAALRTVKKMDRFSRKTNSCLQKTIPVSTPSNKIPAALTTQ